MICILLNDQPIAKPHVLVPLRPALSKVRKDQPLPNLKNTLQRRRQEAGPRL